PIRACDQRLDRHHTVGAGLVPHRAPLCNPPCHEGRLTHTCPVEKLALHGVFPGTTGYGLDHPAEHAPAHIRIRPEVIRRPARGSFGYQPRERAVVLVLPTLEAEFQVDTQRKPGTIR